MRYGEGSSEAVLTHCAARRSGYPGGNDRHRWRGFSGYPRFLDAVLRALVFIVQVMGDADFTTRLSPSRGWVRGTSAHPQPHSANMPNLRVSLRVHQCCFTETHSHLRMRGRSTGRSPTWWRSTSMMTRTTTYMTCTCTRSPRCSLTSTVCGGCAVDWAVAIPKNSGEMHWQR